MPKVECLSCEQEFEPTENNDYLCASCWDSQGEGGLTDRDENNKEDKP